MQSFQRQKSDSKKDARVSIPIRHQSSMNIIDALQSTVPEHGHLKARLENRESVASAVGVASMRLKRRSEAENMMDDLNRGDDYNAGLEVQHESTEETSVA